MNAPLFRQSALNAQHPKWLGEIILIRPLTFTFFTLFAATVALALIAFAYFGTYTKRSTVIGQLNPDTGLLKIYPTQTAVVVQKMIVEGQQVKQGDTLFVLSAERHSNTQADVQAAISGQVLQRQQSYQLERRQTQQIQAEEKVALQQKIAAMQSELTQLNSSISLQQSRVNLAVETAARYKGLAQQDYVSREQAQQKQEELIDQQARLQTLQRDQISTARELHVQQAELANLTLKQQTQLAQIERNIASTKQELTESDAKRQVVITAPQSGTVAAINAELGQNVDVSHALASIVPRNATLQAQLYAPSKAIGFIKLGDSVLVRYQAYPYQKFGHAHGVVSQLSRAALLGNELNGYLAGNSSLANEPFYKITVVLDKQAVTAYGAQQALQAGMLLEADVLQDKRRLIEWVLEPLTSLTGKL